MRVSTVDEEVNIEPAIYKRLIPPLFRCLSLGTATRLCGARADQCRQGAVAPLPQRGGEGQQLDGIHHQAQRGQG